MSLLAKINQTPGLLENFKLICIDSTPGFWQGLSAEEKALFEQYKEALAQS